MLWYFILLLLFIPVKAISQTDTLQLTRNSIYLEAGGIGGIWSLNYEQVIHTKADLRMGVRTGISTYPVADYTGRFNPDIFIPMALTGVLGQDHCLELGFGQTFSHTVQTNYADGEPERQSALHSNFTVGYRYRPNKGGILFRCSYTPIIDFNRSYRHWGGLSIGYTF